MKKDLMHCNLTLYFYFKRPVDLYGVVKAQMRYLIPYASHLYIKIFVSKVSV